MIGFPDYRKVTIKREWPHKPDIRFQLYTYHPLYLVVWKILPFIKNILQNVKQILHLSPKIIYHVIITQSV